LAFTALCACLDTTQALVAAPLAKDAATESHKTISEDIAFLLTSLIVDAMQRPDVNVIDSYAAAAHWEKNPPEINALLNARMGYHGKISGQKVVLGGDGTNDVIAAMINQGFEPERVVAAVRQAFTLKVGDTEDSAGQRSVSYYVLDSNKPIGVVLLTYGVATAIRGTGSVVFLSMKKVNQAISK
jgi:hypothetical protein